MGWPQEKNYNGIRPIGAVREDYHFLQGSREEFFNGTRYPSKHHNLVSEHELDGENITIRTVPILPLQPPPVATWRLQACL